MLRGGDDISSEVGKCPFDTLIYSFNSLFVAGVKTVVLGLKSLALREIGYFHFKALQGL
jgi:hypothetical protein